MKSRILLAALAISMVAVRASGQNWTKCTPVTSPPARGYHAMAYDAARRRVLLFGGGVGNLNDTWEYAGTLLLANGTARPGGSVSLALTAPGDEGKPFQVGSSLGTGPIPVDTRQIDLSPDNLLAVSVTGLWPGIFSGYRGIIGTNGQAKAAINIPNFPVLIGLRLHTAFVTLSPSAPSGIRSISNTFSFSITK